MDDTRAEKLKDFKLCYNKAYQLKEENGFSDFDLIVEYMEYLNQLNEKYKFSAEELGDFKQININDLILSYDITKLANKDLKLIKEMNLSADEMAKYIKSQEKFINDKPDLIKFYQKIKFIGPKLRIKLKRGDISMEVLTKCTGEAFISIRCFTFWPHSNFVRQITVDYIEKNLISFINSVDVLKNMDYFQIYLFGITQYVAFMDRFASFDKTYYLYEKYCWKQIQYCRKITKYIKLSPGLGEIIVGYYSSLIEL